MLTVMTAHGTDEDRRGGTTTMKRILLCTAATGAVLLLAACGNASKSHSSDPAKSSSMAGISMGSGSTGSTGTTGSTTLSKRAAQAPASGKHNAADIAFVTDMIPHHQLAITMADLATSKASDDQVKQLAAGIKKAQEPEITIMSGWLSGWVKSKSATPANSGHEGFSAPGSASHGGRIIDAEVVTLENATGAAFDRMWVTMMINHHAGAIQTARTEVALGANTDAKKLAESIRTSQGTESGKLKELLATLPH
jgi:uncharacterized protein (DUF305 family)